MPGPIMRSLCELCLHPCCSVIRQSQNFPSFTSSVFSRGERCSRQPKLDHSHHTKWAPWLPPIFAAVTWIWCRKHTVEGGQVIYSVNANCNECGFGVEAKIHSRPPHNMNGSSRQLSCVASVKSQAGELRWTPVNQILLYISIALSRNVLSKLARKRSYIEDDPMFFFCCVGKMVDTQNKVCLEKIISLTICLSRFSFSCELVKPFSHPHHTHTQCIKKSYSFSFVRDILLGSKNNKAHQQRNRNEESYPTLQVHTVV